MFDSILNTAKDKIFSIIDELDEPVYFSNLLAIDQLPLQYSKFFRAELNRQVYEFKLLLSGLFNFDFYHPNFVEIYGNFLEDLDKIARLDRQALEDLVFEAVKFRMHFLLQPRKVLLDFIYKNALHKIKEEILIDLEYFADYEYLTEELKKRIQEHKSVSLSRIEFQLLIAQIDNHFFAHSNVSEIRSALIPLFELFNPDNLEDIASIPSLALYYLFKDKEYTSLANFFLNEFEKKSDSAFTMEDLGEILCNSSSPKPTLKEEFRHPEFVNFFCFEKISPEAFLLPKQIPELNLPSFSDATMKEETTFKSISSTPSDKHRALVEILKKIDNDFDVENKAEDTEKSGLDDNMIIELGLAPDFRDQTFRDSTMESEFDTTSSNDLEQETNRMDEYDTEHTEEVYLEQNNSAELEIISNEIQIENSTITEKENSLPPSISQEIEAKEEKYQKFPAMIDIITQEMRTKFINELFYSMEDEYESLVQKIDETESIEKALMMVNTFFHNFGIFEGAPIAQQFVEFVRKKFGA